MTEVILEEIATQFCVLDSYPSQVLTCFALLFLFLTEMVALLEWWSGTECTLYTDPESYPLYGKENAIVILNHNFEIDFLCGWTFCERFGVLGVRIFSVLKR